MHDETTK